MMEVIDPPGGPIKLIVAPNQCPSDSASPLTLAIPATVWETATQEQQARIAKIQIDYAQRVSRVLLRAYGAISTVLDKDAPQKKTAEAIK